MNEPTTKELLPLEVGATRLLPALEAGDRAELRTAAYPILAAARTAAAAVQQLAAMKRDGFWQAAVVSASSAFSAIAAGVCLLGAAFALVVSADDPEPTPPATAPSAPDVPPVDAGGANPTAPGTEN